METSTKPDRTESRPGPYRGYYQPTPVDDSQYLTDVRRGTPCGEYMRRYWHPFLLSSELADLPLAVKLLGEDLVVFRDKSGAVGLMHKHCAHRGASLEYGVIAEHGIMCCYHGWHFDIDGTILSTPAEPPSTKICEKFVQGAYPVREMYGMLFAYLGPPEEMPEFPLYDTFAFPADNRLVPFRYHLPCNWLQIVDNAADPIHNAYLHAIVSQQFGKGFNVLPVLDFVETPIGFLAMATRRVKDYIFVRSSDMILPNVSQFTRGSRDWRDEETVTIGTATTRWAVPLDNENSFYIGFTHLNERTQRLRPLRDDQIGVGKGSLIGQTADRPYEERQRAPGDFDALTGQGAIANRKREHLGTTDRGITLMRKLLAQAIGAVEKGAKPAIPRTGSNPVRTYVHEIILELPKDSPIGDNETVKAFGRSAARLVIESDNAPLEKREEVAGQQARALAGQPEMTPAR